MRIFIGIKKDSTGVVTEELECQGEMYSLAQRYGFRVRMLGRAHVLMSKALLLDSPMSPLDTIVELGAILYTSGYTRPGEFVPRAGKSTRASHSKFFGRQFRSGLAATRLHIT